MPKRTIGMETVRARPGRNRKKQYANLSDIEGFDLLHLFHGWADSVPPNDLVDQHLGRYKKITDVVPTGRSVMVEVEAGFFGTAGKTYDTETHTVSHSRTARESATVMTRLLLTIAPGAEVGIFTSEREGTSGAGPDLVKLFKQDLVSNFPTYSFDTETVIESPAWAQGADLLAVTAVAYAVPVNLANGVVAQPTMLGQLEQRFEPVKGQKVLPQFLLTGLQDRTIAASDFMGFADGRDIDETFVTVGRDGREKTYALDKQRVPSIRVVITEDGEQPLTTTPFIRACQTEVRDYYQGMGFSWDESWRSGKWTPEQLKVTVPTKA